MIGSQAIIVYIISCDISSMHIDTGVIDSTAVQQSTTSKNHISKKKKQYISHPIQCT